MEGAGRGWRFAGGARILVLILSTTIVRAQGPGSAPITGGPDACTARNSFTIVGSATFANGTIKGDAFDRHLVLTGIRYNRMVMKSDVLALSYAAELLPAAWLFQPVFGDDHQSVQRSVPPLTHTETTFAAGANPIGAELMFRPHRALQPLVGTNEGFLYFSRNVPSVFAARFNFALGVRLGLRVRLDRGRALSVEYIYHHFSNAYRAVENAGVDSQMVSFGYQFTVRGS